MEQLIIFLLFVVASIVSSIIQKKKQAEQEAAARRELERPSPGGPGPKPAQPPVARWPRSAQEWQDQLRKMLEENAPPVIKPVIVPERRVPPTVPQPTPVKALPPRERSEGDIAPGSPLRGSISAHERVANIQERVEKRLRAADQQTTLHRPVTVRAGGLRRPQAVLRKLRHKPAALREAFIASLIFSAPKSLERPETVL